MYNSRDIYSKCSAMCIHKYPKSIYNDTYELKDNMHVCECKIKEEFTPIKQSTINNPILGKEIKNDSLFSDRNYVEKTQSDRLSSLIFGQIQ